MPEINWNVILSGVAYAALTGVFNLIFAHKSQINAWAEANPRAAALLKFTRSIGFDPQHFWAFLTLLVKRKLPAVQTGESTDNERGDGPGGGNQRPVGIKPIPSEPDEEPPSLPGAALLGLALLVMVGCSPAQAVGPCSEVALATVTAGCEARIKDECAANDRACPVYLECKQAVRGWRSCGK